MWTHKNVKVVSKYKLKTKALSNEGFISELHWNFLNIYFLSFKSFKWDDCYKFFENSFYVQNFNLFHGFFDQSHV
jgi:hypothetical protein